MSSMKVALITGCSSGFGHAMVARLLEEGFTVLATMRNAASRGALFAPERSRYGQKLEIHELDVTLASDRARITQLIDSRFGGRLDVLVNNAGFGLFGALEDMNEDQIARQIDVNFLAVAYLTRGLLPALRKAQGRLINISSFFGVSAAPLNSLYCASKFALEGFSEALYYELLPYGVQVALVEPGAVKTKFGANVMWGKRCFDAKSPYAFQTANYEMLKKKIGDRAPGVDEVVRTVARLTRVRRMPLRNFCGRDAKSLRRMLRLMPTSVSTAFMRLFYARTFGNRKTLPLTAPLESGRLEA